MPDQEAAAAGPPEALDSFAEDIPTISVEHIRVWTASRLARLLVLILLTTFVLHFGAVFYVVYTSDHADIKTDAIDRVFNVWVPIISGLVGTAVAYFLGEKKKSGNA